MRLEGPKHTEIHASSETYTSGSADYKFVYDLNNGVKSFREVIIHKHADSDDDDFDCNWVALELSELRGLLLASGHEDVASWGNPDRITTISDLSSDTDGLV